jgi:uncharacterized protein
MNPVASTRFHVLTKPTGAICNLDCKYCFFLSKEDLYPNSRFRMTDDILERYIRQQVESQQDPEVTISWQGGEPTLMGLDFFRRSVELAQRYKRPEQTLRYTIQTNGTLLDEDWAAPGARYVKNGLSGARAFCWRIHATVRSTRSTER